MGTFHRTYSPFHHLRATMAFAVSTQALAAKVALNGKTLNVRKSSVKAARNVTVRAAVSAPAGLKAGVVTGDDYRAVIDHAKKNGYAIPAVNCTMSTVTNACLEAAKVANSPMIIQFSNGGGIYNAGKGWKNEADQKAAIMGCVAGALHVRALAGFYGLIEANEAYFAKHGEPLFTSHMLDLSEEPMEENIEICKKYLERMSKINCFLEMEIGITGGEEDGVDNSDVAPEDLYSKPEEIYDVYQALTPIAPGFYSIAAAFGNVHGVY